MFKKTEDSYLVKYDYGEKYYTNNKYLIKLLKAEKFYNRIARIFGTLFVVFLFALLISFVPYDEDSMIQPSKALTIINIIFGSICGFSLIISLIFVGVSVKVGALDLFLDSEEYIQQVKGYAKIQQKKIEEKKRVKATQLTNVYETLDSDLNKEQKIDKIMEYLD